MHHYTLRTFASRFNCLKAFSYFFFCLLLLSLLLLLLVVAVVVVAWACILTYQLALSVLLDTDIGHNGTHSTTKQQESRKSGYGVQAKRASKQSTVKLQPPAYGRTKYDHFYLHFYYNKHFCTFFWKFSFLNCNSRQYS